MIILTRLQNIYMQEVKSLLQLHQMFFDLTLDPSSKYYPGKGITPALAGATELSLYIYVHNRVIV